MRFATAVPAAMAIATFAASFALFSHANATTSRTDTSSQLAFVGGPRTRDGNDKASPAGVGSSRLFQVLLVLLGVVVGFIVQALYAHFKPPARARMDLRAHLLSVVPIGKTIQIEVAIANRGNRKAAIAELVPSLSFEGGGALFPSPATYEVSASAFVLDPGDIQTVSILLRADIARMYHNAGAAPWVATRVDPPPGEREVQLAVGIRALDHEGVRYKGLWKFATLRLTLDRIVSWSSTQDSLGVFGREFRASLEGLDLLPFCPHWDNAANEPEPPDSGESSGTEP